MQADTIAPRATEGGGKCLNPGRLYSKHLPQAGRGRYSLVFTTRRHGGEGGGLYDVNSMLQETIKKRESHKLTGDNVHNL